MDTEESKLPPPDALTREQLLEALDAEIASAQSESLAKGHTNWALIVSLSAIFWLCIQTAGAPDVSARKVALIAIAASLLWGFVLNLGNCLDRGVLARQTKGEQFLPLAPYMGPLRSVALFSTLRHTGILGVAWWVNAPGLIVVEFYSGCAVIFGVVSLFLDYDAFPPYRIPEPTSKRGIGDFLMRFVIGAQIVVSGGAAVTAAAVALGRALQTSNADVRAGILVAAFFFIADLLVRGRFPARMLSETRALRRDVAFRRVSVEEARCNLRILLPRGWGIVEVMERDKEVVITAAAKMGLLYDEIEDLLPNYSNLSKKPNSDPCDSNEAQESKKESDRLYKIIKDLKSETDFWNARMDKALKRMENQMAVVSIESPSAARQMSDVLKELKLQIDPLLQRRQAVEVALKG